MSGMPPSSPSNRPSSSPSRSGSQSNRNVPLGIYVIVLLGGITSVLGFIPIFAIMAQGPFVLGLLLLVLNVAQLAVLVGLVRLRSWAFIWTLILYGLSALTSLFRADILGFLIALLIIAYLFSKAEYFDQ